MDGVRMVGNVSNLDQKALNEIYDWLKTNAENPAIKIRMLGESLIKLANDSERKK